MSDKPEPQWLKPVVDYVPLVLFFVSYNYSDDLVLATKVIIVATVAAVLLSIIVSRRVPLMALVTAIIIGVFGGLTIYLQDDTFIKMKPTIIQSGFALVLGIGLLLKRLWIKPLFGNAFEMADRAWKTLTLRFIVFLLTSAVLNEIIWRTQGTDIWVNFKVFGLMGLMLLFMAAQIPFIQRHSRGA